MIPEQKIASLVKAPGSVDAAFIGSKFFRRTFHNDSVGVGVEGDKTVVNFTAGWNVDRLVRNSGIRGEIIVLGTQRLLKQRKHAPLSREGDSLFVTNLIVTNVIDDRHVPLYGEGNDIRDWLHVDYHCRGIAMVLVARQPGRQARSTTSATAPN